MAPGVAGGFGLAPSLSKCHNFHEEGKKENPQQNEAAPPERLLTGSAAKTATALRWNASVLVERAGLNSVGFMTFTPGDYWCRSHGKQLPTGKQRCPCCRSKLHFLKIHDADEANRRVKSFYGGVLDDLFPVSIIVKERHQDGGNHFHILGELAGRPDIRTGFDFTAVRRGDYASVNPELKAIWKMLREKAPLYGMGARVELLPVRKTAGAVASYVSKYIEKHIAHRQPEDRGRRLVRYHGFHRCQLKANEFEWDGQHARAWRQRTRDALAIVGVSMMDVPVAAAPHVVAACATLKIRAKCLEGSEAREVLGPRWAFLVNLLLERLDVAKGDRLVCDYPTKQLLSGELQRLVGRRWCRDFENPPPREWLGQPWSWRESNDFSASYPKTPEEQQRQRPRSLNELVLQWQCRHCQTSFSQPRTHCCNGQLRMEKYETANLSNLTAGEMDDYLRCGNRFPDWNSVMANPVK
jgi:hypothetical protein